MKNILTICMAALLICNGCLWSKVKKEETAQELADKGIHEFNDGNYKYSLEFFEKIKDWYPFSNYAIVAELKIADAHYHLKEYEEAVVAYEQFESLHPNNDQNPYVLYQIGMCFFEQMDTLDRDQTPASKTLEAFQQLTRRYPETQYARQAEEKIRRCIKSLAGHEFSVGLFYYKMKRYKAALNRFKAVISDYPDVGLHVKAMNHMAMCESQLENIQAKLASQEKKDEPLTNNVN
jgi:outer membrane protein assembly factor BamD